MKKLIFAVSICLLLLSGPGTFAYSRPVTSAPTAVTMTPERAEQLTNRLKEIRAMDISKLSRTERKALRKEVKSIKKEAYLAGGLYISAGALIIILLLLLLL